MSNLWHLLWAIFVCIGLYWQYVRIAYTPERSRSSAMSAATQLVALALIADLILGFTVIDKTFGSGPSAGWISKATIFYPILLLLSYVCIWRQVTRARIKASQIEPISAKKER